MNKFILFGLMLLCPIASAKQFGFLPDNYFRPIGPGNFHLSDGISFPLTESISDLRNLTLIALATHNNTDGSLLPDSWVKAGYAEAWTPIACGAESGAGSTVVRCGPGLNLGPQLQQGILDLLNFTSPNNLQGFKSIFTKTVNSKVDIEILVSVNYGLKIVADGALLSPNKWWSIHNWSGFFGPGLKF